MKRMCKLLLSAVTMAALWFNPLTASLVSAEGRGNGGHLLSFQSINYPDRFIRHRDYQGFLDPVAGDGDQQAIFRSIPGLVGSQTVSLEASNNPNYFLVAEGEAVALRRRPPNDAEFDLNATFIGQPGLADRSAVSLESMAQRGSYLRHSGFVLFVHPMETSDVFKADTTFRVVRRDGSAGVVKEPDKVDSPRLDDPDRDIALIRPGEEIEKNSMKIQNLHYLIFESSGDLCVYRQPVESRFRSADDKRVWCISDDPKVKIRKSHVVRLEDNGQLKVHAQHGPHVWKTPEEVAHWGSVLFISRSGQLKLRSPGGVVVWSSPSN